MHLQRCAMALTQRSVVCAVLATVAIALIAMTPVNGGPSTIQRVIAVPKGSPPPACTNLHDDWVGTLPYFELQLSVENGNALGCGESDASLYDEKDSLAISEHALTYINNRTLHVIRGTNAADLQSCHEIATIDLLAAGVFVENPFVEGYYYNNRNNDYEATSMVAASQSDENEPSVWNHTVVIGFDRATYYVEGSYAIPQVGVVVVVDVAASGIYEIQTIEYPDLGDLDHDHVPGFGRAVAISANGLVLAVGAPTIPSSPQDSLGEVFVYERQSIDADFPDQPTRRLTDSVENRLYGRSLALSDDGQYLVVGAGGIDLAADKNLHYAELVDLTAGHTVELVAYDKDEMPGSARNFGTQVAIDDGLIAVAAPRDSRDNNVGSDGGSIYLFKLDENGAVEALEPKLYQCSGETDCGQASDADQDGLGRRWLQLARYGETGRLVIADDYYNAPKAVFYSRRGDFGDTKSLIINTVKQHKKQGLFGANTANLFGLSRDLTLAMVLGDNYESVLVVSDELHVALDLAPSSECVGDHNNDGLVNVTDLLKVIGAWGDCQGSCGDPLECTADTNNDGIINVLDKLKVIENWGVCQ